MDTQIDHLLCKVCAPRVAAALDVERTQRAAEQARDRLRALGVDPGSVLAGQETTKRRAPAEQGVDVKPPVALAADPFKGRRGSRWRDVPIAQVLRNIRGDISPNDLCDKLDIATSVLRSRVKDIIGQPDSGKRWQKGIGYLVKNKPAWDHEQDTLRVDKTKGAAMASIAKAKPSRKLAGKSLSAEPKSRQGGPTDDELRAYAAGKISASKLARKHKCANSTVYRAINAYKIRFGADAPHGEPKPVSVSNGTNGVTKLPNGVKPPPMVDVARIVSGN